MFWTIVGAILFAFIGVPLIVFGAILIIKRIQRELKTKNEVSGDNLIQEKISVSKPKIKEFLKKTIPTILSILALGLVTTLIILLSSLPTAIKISTDPVIYKNIEMSVISHNLGSILSEKNRNYRPYQDPFSELRSKTGLGYQPRNILDNNSDTYTTSGIFISFILTIENTSQTTATNQISEVTLIDAKGREFSPYNQIIGEVFTYNAPVNIYNNREIIHTETRPGFDGKIAFVFEVPADYISGKLSFKIK